MAHVLVTGSVDGLGRASAQALLDAGHKVVVHARSDEFRQLWARHDVRFHISGVKRYHHPVVGRLDLRYEVLHLPEEDGHRLLLQYAEPGSADHDTLRLLASRSVTD